MSERKVHYCDYEQDMSNGTWDPSCSTPLMLFEGHDLRQMTDDWHRVTCKRCLKRGGE